MDLPDYDELRRQSQKPFEEIKAEWKRKGQMPPRTFQERKLIISSTGGIFEEYIPPEGDGKASLISTERAKQGVIGMQKKGKSMLEARKIKKYDPDFDTALFSQEAQEIYMTVQELLQDVKKNEDKLHELVTEKAYGEMTWRLDRSTLRWKFIESLEHPRVVHARTTQLMNKFQLFGQVTVRMHTKQTLALYDRFGRLAYGNEVAIRDCLEYVVLEKYLSEEYSKWRVHGRIIPVWQKGGEGVLRTLQKPKRIDHVETKNDDLTPKPTEEESQDSKEQLQLAH